MRLLRDRRCPHIGVRGVYGDEILHHGGRRRQCTSCWTYLDGPLPAGEDADVVEAVAMRLWQGDESNDAWFHERDGLTSQQRWDAVPAADRDDWRESARGVLAVVRAAEESR